MSKNFLAKKYQAEPEEDIFGSGGVTWDDVIYLNIEMCIRDRPSTVAITRLLTCKSRKN